MKLFATLTTFALSVVVAYPGAVFAFPSRRTYDSECSTGTLQCCNSLERADSDKASTILDALQLNVPSDQHVGLACNTIPVGSVGGASSCNAMPVCCNSNQFGHFAINCSPITFIL